MITGFCLDFSLTSSLKSWGSTSLCRVFVHFFYLFLFSVSNTITSMQQVNVDPVIQYWECLPEFWRFGEQNMECCDIWLLSVTSQWILINIFYILYINIFKLERSDKINSVCEIFKYACIIHTIILYLYSILDYNDD